MIKGLFFDKTATRGVLTRVHTIVDTQGPTSARFPVFENLMGSEFATQECVVTVYVAHKKCNYLVAAQWDPSAPVNRGLSEISHREWRGSITVVRVGTRVSFAGISDGLDRCSAQNAVER